MATANISSSAWASTLGEVTSFVSELPQDMARDAVHKFAEEQIFSQLNTLSTPEERTAAIEILQSLKGIDTTFGGEESSPFKKALSKNIRALKLANLSGKKNSFQETLLMHITSKGMIAKKGPMFLNEFIKDNLASWSENISVAMSALKAAGHL